MKSLNFNNDHDTLLSKTIDFLRFPLIVGVIFIHNSSPIGLDGSLSVDQANFPLFNYFQYLFSQILSRVAVPIFFFISGFLFFYKVNSFTPPLYISKLQKRVRTLLIPYLFWNLIFFVLYYVCSHLPYIEQFFHSEIAHYDLADILIGIYSENEKQAFPLAYQFWFIRDLIVCVIISPILYWLVTKTRHLGVILLGIGWLIGYEIPYIGVRGFSMVALFFFSLGAWFSSNRKDVISIFSDLNWMALFYPILLIIDLFTKQEPFNIYIHKTGILCGIVFCFLLVAYLIDNKKIKGVPLLTSASFFIFAVHDPWLLSRVHDILNSIIHTNSDIVITIIYFLTVFFVATIAIGIYYVIKKLMPTFTSLITGGR